MKRKNKGFTLIELLAVIVILGLLMAIAIPSVTKYITESRKKTLTTTVGNYIGALVNEVNDLSYTFTGQNMIYAVPIECIALERGGTNPFGHWYQANDAYFAYVLIQYDDVNSKYVYGFTFKDSAGYGLYPTTQENINEKGSQVKTGYTLNKPKTGELTSLTTLAKWQESGFEVDSSTYLQVLEATSENEIGNGTTTCTLQQKGDNYAQVEEEKNNILVGDAIPTGGTYYVGVTSMELGTYTGYSAKYVAGDSFPSEVKTGDVYVYGDYEYRYNLVWYQTWMDFDSGIALYPTIFSGYLELTNGWGVRVLNDKTNYGKMLSVVNKKPVTSVVATYAKTSVESVSELSSNATSIAGAFYECTNLKTSPTLPNSVVNMPGVFWGCSSLLYGPDVPVNAKEVTHAFAFCSSLSGTIVINANPTTYSNFLYHTVKPITLSGTSMILQQLAATADKGNVTYN